MGYEKLLFMVMHGEKRRDGWTFSSKMRLRNAWKIFEFLVRVKILLEEERKIIA